MIPQDTWVKLVRKTLVESGCNPALIRPLDPGATVEITLKDGPPLFITCLEEQVMLWSDLCEFHVSLVRLRSEALQQEVMTPFPYSASKQLALRESEGNLQLYTDLDDIDLSDTKDLGQALEAFLTRQLRLLDIIRQ
ncbi:hypothetical protein [Herbaspirillum sp. SJZ099]|uniref:InvB/SpaK family type III secretion system chaperone n=1 Tax=Herbaspirillum sp. SJZ099 TaxID=2572916 RepID=UPI0011A89CB8|nr:hypothetical protein [Herbaspirillum sp. SJZ099]TWC66613.1 invasion protein B family protein [Herbaspirillum sp. SJZ099]